MRAGRSLAYHLLSSCGLPVLGSRAASRRWDTAGHGRAPSWACVSRVGPWSLGPCFAARYGQADASCAPRTNLRPASAACGRRVRACARSRLAGRPWRRRSERCVRDRSARGWVSGAGRRGRWFRPEQRRCWIRHGGGCGRERRGWRDRATGAGGIGGRWAGPGQRRCGRGRAGARCGHAGAADYPGGADARRGPAAAEFCERAFKHDASDDFGSRRRSGRQQSRRKRPWDGWRTAGHGLASHRCARECSGACEHRPARDGRACGAAAAGEAPPGRVRRHGWAGSLASEAARG